MPSGGAVSRALYSLNNRLDATEVVILVVTNENGGSDDMFDV